jgi:hypothetical protein
MDSDQEAEVTRTAEFSMIFLRDIDRLADEVRAYPGDDAPWVSPPGIHNPGGTLAVHLAGNLQHFIGAVLGGSGYERDRDREFAVRGLSLDEILGEIGDARGAVAAAFEGLSDARLEEPWTGGGPLGETATVGAMLLHLSGHLMYHVGQVNYHRRLLT